MTGHLPEKEPSMKPIKYRIESGKLTLWFQLTQLEEIIAEEARQILEAISLATGILVYRGTPS